MLRRLLVSSLLAAMVFSIASCHNKKAQNPIADLGSKQPDKVLFDRAMDALKHNRFDVTRLTLQTLINTYPDSEFIARAKLAIGDSWYAEGGTAALAQAENEYRDFITFFPNMPEAAEAQLKVADIHYHQMEKPDRDFTHAKRAEDEYRQLILQFPDSKLVAQAKDRLREVQEVLAEREFRVGHFYYMRESWPAAIARLKSLADAYPLYSGADEALFQLGDSYEREIARLRAIPGVQETVKGKLIKEYTDRAAEAYSRIIVRYPVTDRVSDARQRLTVLNRPIPVPTQDAVALNKSEEESRQRTGMVGRVMLNLQKHPDMAQAARVGEPTLVDPKPTSAAEILKRANEIVQAASVKTTGGKGSQAVSVETVKPGDTPPPSQPVPRSPQPAGSTDPNAIPELKPLTEGTPDAGSTPGASGTPTQTAEGSTAPVPPQQVNDAKTGTGSEVKPDGSGGSDQTAPDPKKQSSSKKKQKKGLKKLIPF